MTTKILMAIYAATVVSCCREYLRVMRILEKKTGHERQSIFMILSNNVNSIIKFFIPFYNFYLLILLLYIDEKDNNNFTC